MTSSPLQHSKTGRAFKMYSTEDKIVDALGAFLWTGILILMMAV